MEGLDKTDENLLTKINGLQTDNAQSLDGNCKVSSNCQPSNHKNLILGMDLKMLAVMEMNPKVLQKAWVLIPK